MCNKVTNCPYGDDESKELCGEDHEVFDLTAEILNPSEVEVLEEEEEEGSGNEEEEEEDSKSEAIDTMYLLIAGIGE